MDNSNPLALKKR